MISADIFEGCPIGGFKIEYVRQEDKCIEFHSTDMVDEQGEYFVIMVACYIPFSIKTIKLYYNPLILIFDYINKELSLLMSNKN